LLLADFFYLSTLVQHFPSRIFSKIEVTVSLRKHRMIQVFIAGLDQKDKLFSEAVSRLADGMWRGAWHGEGR
jgi:hypothetical protein